jgi:hypothetical protein
MTKRLVINGMETVSSVMNAVNFDGDRIPLPARVAELAQLTGDNAIDCWLLVVTAGRYRLILKLVEGATSATSFSRVLRHWQELGGSGDVLDSTSSNEQAGIRARLIPTVVAPMTNGWRITVPKEAKMLVPTGEDRSFVFIVMVAGFIEFWFPDTLRRAVWVPLAGLLQGL